MSQTDRILAHLQREPITPLQALRLYGCLRLGARILDLRSKGYAISTDLIEVSGRKRVARYSLDMKRKQKPRQSGDSAPARCRT